MYNGIKYEAFLTARARFSQNAEFEAVDGKTLSIHASCHFQPVDVRLYTKVGLMGTLQYGTAFLNWTTF